MRKHIGFSAVFLLSFILGQIQVIAQNVGIGTITPTSKLTIAGNEGTNNGQNASLKIENLNSDNAWFIRAGAIGTTTPNGGLSIGDNAAYRLAITSNGLVGIGLLEPFETLHLNGNIRQDFSLKGIIQNGADAAMITRGFDPFSSGKHIGLGRWGLFMEPSTLTLGIPDLPGKRMAVSTFNTNSLVAKELLVVSQNGNVGIGLTAPTALLHVNGGIKVNNNNPLEFGAGVAGKEANAGKITYGNFSPHMLEIMGGGTLTSNRVVRFFNEGYAWFNGPIFLSKANITSLRTGNANLLPIAYGEVSSIGTIGISHSTSNFAIAKIGTGTYEVLINDISASARVTVSVTPKAAATPRLATYTGGVGIDKIVIYIYNISGALIDGGFGFVIYSPID